MQFLQNYNNPKNIRFKSFEFALNEAKKRNHKIIVETGVARGKTKFLFQKSGYLLIGCCLYKHCCLCYRWVFM